MFTLCTQSTQSTHRGIHSYVLCESRQSPRAEWEEKTYIRRTHFLLATFSPNRTIYINSHIMFARCVLLSVFSVFSTSLVPFCCAAISLSLSLFPSNSWFCAEFWCINITNVQLCGPHSIHPKRAIHMLGILLLFVCCCCCVQWSRLIASLWSFAPPI